jgi:hypothetical protein
MEGVGQKNMAGPFFASIAYVPMGAYAIPILFTILPFLHTIKVVYEGA